MCCAFAPWIKTTKAYSQTRCALAPWMKTTKAYSETRCAFAPWNKITIERRINSQTQVCICSLHQNYKGVFIHRPGVHLLPGSKLQRHIPKLRCAFAPWIKTTNDKGIVYRPGVHLLPGSKLQRHVFRPGVHLLLGGR